MSSSIPEFRQKDCLNYFGPVEPSFVTVAAKFLASCTDGAEEQLAQSLDTFIKATQADCVGTAREKEHCWFEIRVDRPKEDFKTPRWHQDGPMRTYQEAAEGEPRSKYATTLLGPCTLLLPSNPKILETQAYVALREWLADQFEDKEPINLTNRNIARFTWGRDDSPVHSEPNIVSDRVFITVIYGSQDEIQTLWN
ncbi:hypothetical protein BDV95DRAFT_618378 [Massariosphaeria phaeospora]|uniref:Clavaminate synthase-like protein n=1 Tax=Massariosphaeria phaeospora TaxID=100035 RepID=A0A7C8IB72_9PLEO|nr:hypothetical protein BDV95DRAFT_618378 [Massariosphaeria phaeospora]